MVAICIVETLETVADIVGQKGYKEVADVRRFVAAGTAETQQRHYKQQRLDAGDLTGEQRHQQRGGDRDHQCRFENLAKNDHTSTQH